MFFKVVCTKFNIPFMAHTMFLLDGVALGVFWVHLVINTFKQYYYIPKSDIIYKILYDYFYSQ